MIWEDRYFLVTFHPVTLEHSTAQNQFKNLLDVLDQVTADSNDPIKIIFTKANADTDGRIINRLIDDYVTEHSDKSIAFTSMGTLRYLSAMKTFCCGGRKQLKWYYRSAYLKVPTVNIGKRQKGRGAGTEYNKL